MGATALTQQLGGRANNQGNSNYGSLGNIGLDFRVGQAGSRTTITAPPINGVTVAYAGDGAGAKAALGEGFGTLGDWGKMLGNTTVLRFPSGHYMFISHQSGLAVQTGQKLAPGQLLGVSGDTGNAQGVHADVMFYRPDGSLISAGVGGANRRAAMAEINKLIKQNMGR